MGTKELAGTARVALACAATAVITLGGCAGAPRAGGGAAQVQPAPPLAAVLVPAPIPADLGVVERFAWQTVVQMGESLAAGDTPGFLAKVSRAFYRGYSAIETAVANLVAAGPARAVVVAVQEVRTEEERVSVRAKWSRSGKGGATVTGETVFLFRKSDQSLRLFDYQGDPPFGLEGI